VVDIADLREQEAPEAEIREFRKVLRDFASVDPKTIPGPEFGDELNFSSRSSTLEELTGILVHLLELPPEKLPRQLAARATSSIQSLRTHRACTMPGEAVGHPPMPRTT
jgi:hypothetical protein